MSVVIRKCMGRHGNQLCPFFVGKIISENLKYKMFGPQADDKEFCLHDIELNYNKDGYSYYETPIQFIGNESISYAYAHPDINLDDIINDKTPRRIILDGYFQKKRYFLPYKEQIKQWYGYNKQDIPADHVAMHIRLGDLRQTNHPDLLPREYYEEALNQISNFSKLTICTDTPSDPYYIQYFIDKYNATIFSANEKDTISFLASHNNLILSVGTFSFWSSFLSDGVNIINAIPKIGNNRIDPNNEVDLLIQSPYHKYIAL